MVDWTKHGDMIRTTLQETGQVRLAFLSLSDLVSAVLDLGIDPATVKFNDGYAKVDKRKESVASATWRLFDNDTDKWNSTWLQGYVDVSYDDLVETFGEPNTNGDAYKTDAEWCLVTDHGIATIYNYKDGINYNGEDGTPTADIRDWHIGGTTPEVVKVVKEALGVAE